MKTAAIDFIKLLMRNWSKLAFVSLLLLVCVPVYEEWSEQHAKEVTEREQRSAREHVGTDASIAGAALWSAYKECSRIDVPDITKCAAYKGQLLQEMAAPILAQTALDQRSSYDSSCKKLFTADYCYNLLNRAFQLSRTAPPSREAGE